MREGGTGVRGSKTASLITRRLLGDSRHGKHELARRGVKPLLLREGKGEGREGQREHHGYGSTHSFGQRNW